MNIRVNIASQARRATFSEQKAARHAAKVNLIATGMPEWVASIIVDKATQEGVDPLKVIGKSRSSGVVMARYAAIYAVKAARPTITAPRVATWFNRDHTTIIYALARYARISGQPSLTSYSLEARFASLQKYHDSRKEKAA